MAEPTFSGTPGNGPAVTLLDATNTSGAADDLYTDHGYRCAVIHRITKPNDNTYKEYHDIMGEGAPSAVATYDDAPLGSVYHNLSGGDGVCMYLKESAGAIGWAAVTTGSEA